MGKGLKVAVRHQRPGWGEEAWVCHLYKCILSGLDARNPVVQFPDSDKNQIMERK